MASIRPLLLVLTVACASAPVHIDPSDVNILSADLGETHGCRALGPVDGSAYIEQGSPDQSESLGVLRVRAMAESQRQVSAIGGNTLLLLDLTEADYSDGSFKVHNVGVALVCP